jgi:hypothetical protein
MADERPLYEQILDVAVFAPLGAATLAGEQLPALVAKGRTVVESRVTVAKMVGRLAVAQMRKKVEGVVGQAGPEAHGAGASGREPTPRAGDGSQATGPAPGASGPRPPRATPDAGGLAIPGYDSLAASQVVRRLDSLTGEELAAVEAYETATRGRRTILGRIAQLEGRTD